MRPAAPARLIASKFIIVLQLPPVMMRAEHGIVVFRIVADESDAHVAPAAPSSSATICAIVLGDVLAHVGLADIDGDEAVRPIEYQTLGSKLPGAARASAERAGHAE